MSVNKTKHSIENSHIRRCYLKRNSLHMSVFYIVPSTLKDSVLILRSLTLLELMSIQGDS